MNCGHSRTSSIEITIPETTPITTSTVSARVSRAANRSQPASLWRRPRKCAIAIATGRPTPSEAKTMWNPSDVPIWARPASKLLIGAAGGCADVARLVVDDFSPACGRAVPSRRSARHPCRPRLSRPSRGPRAGRSCRGLSRVYRLEVEPAFAQQLDPLVDPRFAVVVDDDHVAVHVRKVAYFRELEQLPASRPQALGGVAAEVKTGLVHLDAP